MNFLLLKTIHQHVIVLVHSILVIESELQPQHAKMT